MNLTYEEIDKAETMSSAYEEAYDSLKSAIESLKSTNDSVAMKIADELDDILYEIENDREQYDNICDAAYQQEIKSLNDDYWRSVI